MNRILYRYPRKSSEVSVSSRPKPELLGPQDVEFLLLSGSRALTRALLGLLFQDFRQTMIANLVP